MDLNNLKRWAGVVSVFFVLGLSSSALGEAEAEKQETPSPSVVDGKQVSIEYTLKLEDKTVVDSNVGSEPMKYIQGSQQIIPALEKALEGMKIGESRQVTLAPEEGYGEVNKEAFMEVEKEQVPTDALKVGTELQGQDNTGHTFTARVAEIKDETVVLDFNHPLAGKTLHFDVKVLDIQESPHGFQHP